MPLQQKFLTDTPTRVKTLSIPRQVQAFDASSSRKNFHSELGTSIFDEGALLSHIYNGNIIADCWFPDKILPVLPNAELLTVLMGPDGQPLYDSLTKQWNPRYLPPMLHKVAVPPEQEERELNIFMTIVTDALIRHHDNKRSTTTDPVPDPPSLPSNMDDTASIRATFTPGATSIPDTSSLLPSSSGSHSDPDTPTSRSARRPKQKFPPRLWSSAAAIQPLSGSVAQFKPDSVLVRQPADGTTQTLEWADVLMTAELTSRKETLDLTSQIECKALAMFDAQPNRAFSYSLSFHSGHYRLHMYDRAGGVYSRSYDLHESPLALLRILCAATFAPTSWLGMDDTFDYRLHSSITVDGTQYFIIAKCFYSSVIQGRATHVWFVAKSVPAGSDPKSIFVIKDSWVNVECQLSEEQIFEVLKDIECVPKVEKAWTVQRDGQDDSTSLRRPEAFMSHFKRQCDHRVRRRLVLTPAGRPITHAASPLEVVTCMLDLVIAHKQIWLLGILHRDISINNAMMYEEALPDGAVRVRGLLIDFDRAIKVDESSRMAGPGDRTGTLPFMAVELLRTVDGKAVQHTAAHDLESFVYLLCWIVTLYTGPQSELRDDSAKLALKGWYEGNDLGAFANNKQGCMSSASHIDNITFYYSCLRSCVAALSDLVSRQLYAQRNAHSSPTAQVEYFTGSKRPRSEESEKDPLNHDAVIAILHRTCLFLCNGQIPESGDLLQPYYLTKKDHTSFLCGGASTRTLDLGGGRHLKKRRIIQGPTIQTAL